MPPGEVVPERQLEKATYRSEQVKKGEDISRRDPHKQKPWACSGCSETGWATRCQQAEKRGLYLE